NESPLITPFLLGSAFARRWRGVLGEKRFGVVFGGAGLVPPRRASARTVTHTSTLDGHES
ncbi:MAG: hypothetical protein ACR2GW_08590, partial [Pyrinomonadaceae bacterium]